MKRLVVVLVAVVAVVLLHHSGQQMTELHRGCVADYHQLPAASKQVVTQDRYVHDCETAPYGKP